MRVNLKTCDTCAKQFKRQSLLDRHNRIHTGERPFKCNFCESSFNQKEALIIHEKCHTGIKPYICQFCNAQFAQKGNLKIHIERFHRENDIQNSRMLKCAQCPCIFKTVGSLNAHISRRHILQTISKINLDDLKLQLTNDLEKIYFEFENNNKDSANEILTKIINDRNISSELLKTMLKINNEKIKLDSFIDVKSFIEIKELNEQQLNVAQNDTIGNINIMDSTTGQYKKHYIRKIDKFRYFICYVCQKEFRKPSDLTRHIRIHTYEKPFKCSICSQTFTVKSTLISHMRTHKYVKPYRCSLCFKQFSCDITYRLHIQKKYCKKLKKTDDIKIIETNNENFDPLNPLKTFEDNFKSKKNDQLYDSKSFNFTKHDINEQSIINRDEIFNNSKISTEKVNENINNNDYLNENELFLNSYDFALLLDDMNSFLNTSKDELSNTIEGQTNKNPTKKPKMHQCNVCQKAFQKSNDLLRHKRVHTGERPFKCDQCQNSFTVKNALEAHLRTHLNLPKQYTCTTCFSNFSTKGSLDLHMRIHTGFRPFECDICHSRFRTSSQFKYHLHYKHSIIKRKHTKRVNSFEIENKNLQRSDISQVSNNGTFNVENNSVTYYNSKNENNLFSDFETTPLVVDDLDFTFEIEDDNLMLSTLSQIENDNDINNNVSIDIDFNQNLNFKNDHLNIQGTNSIPSNIWMKSSDDVNEKTIIKKHCCEQCDKSFLKPSQLKRHTLIHTGERPFKCPNSDCNKAFNQKNALTVHLRTHDGLKPYVCGYCQTSFTQNGNLQVHIKRIHKDKSNNFNNEKNPQNENFIFNIQNS